MDLATPFPGHARPLGRSKRSPWRPPECFFLTMSGICSCDIAYYCNGILMEYQWHMIEMLMGYCLTYS